MVSCLLATCPRTHREARDVLLTNWSDLVSERSPVWAVRVDDRPAVVAPTAHELVVVGGGTERAIGFGQIIDVSWDRSVVYVVDDGGDCFDFTFDDRGDAGRAAGLIGQLRASARGGHDGEGAVEQVPGRDGGMSAGIWRGRVVEPVDRLDDELADLEFADWADDGADDGDYRAEYPDIFADAPDAGGGGTGAGTAAAGAGAGTAGTGPDEPGAAPPQERLGAGTAAPVAAEHRDDDPLGTAAPADQEAFGGFGQLPIEREVAQMIARGGRPADADDPGSAVPAAAPVEPAAQEVAIPAQAPAPRHESVLLVTTESVAGRMVAAVHGDVLGVATWPASGVGGPGVHELARARLAQAALQRGGNAVVGLRYQATGAVGGDVAAYGTAVTLDPVEAAEPAAAPARGAGEPA